MFHVPSDNSQPSFGPRPLSLPVQSNHLHDPSERLGARRVLDATPRGLGVARRHQWLELFASGFFVEMANLDPAVSVGRVRRAFIRWAFLGRTTGAPVVLWLLPSHCHGSGVTGSWRVRRQGRHVFQ